MKNPTTFTSAAGTGGRIIAARIIPGQDIIETLEDICRRYDIKYGHISSAIGSLRRVSLNIVTRTTPIPGSGHMTHIEREGPYCLLSGQGLISPGAKPDSFDIHLHIAVRGDTDPVMGGHVEIGTITLSTTEFFIHEVHGVKITRKVDEVVGMPMTTFEQV